ncbi:2-aminoadipate transaminase [Elysia marginata]|uniref:2-aminoadipate transaminase n=1 Tax=Elysia marginata TaxID=1093978 RepID=A0AAV4H3F5_9GAST|nr:2-aminoadipate transaminase [Elysia marginata]
MVTASATQGLHFVLSLLMESSAPIFVEDPSYFRVRKIFQNDFCSETVPVSTDETGMDLDELDKKLTSLKPTPASGASTERYWAVIYVMTVFHNPRGLVYSPGDFLNSLVYLALGTWVCTEALLCVQSALIQRLYKMPSHHLYRGYTTCSGNSSTGAIPHVQATLVQGLYYMFRQLLYRGYTTCSGSSSTGAILHVQATLVQGLYFMFR